MESSQVKSAPTAPWYEVHPFAAKETTKNFTLYKGKTASEKVGNAFITFANSLIPAHDSCIERAVYNSRIRSTLDRVFEEIELNYNIRNGLNHEKNITYNPVGYLKSKEYTPVRKGFDLAVLGPLAATADAITEVCLVVFFLCLIIGVGAKGIYDKIKGNERETNKSWNDFKKIGLILKHIAGGLVITALRIVPVAGVFLSYGVRVLATAGQMKIENAIEERKERQAAGKPFEIISMNSEML